MIFDRDRLIDSEIREDFFPQFKSRSSKIRIHTGDENRLRKERAEQIERMPLKEPGHFYER